MESEKKRGWHRLFPDPGSAATMLIAALIGLAAGGGSTYVVKSSDAVTTTTTQTQTETVTVSEEGEELEEAALGPSTIGLEELNAEEEIQEEDVWEAEFGNRNIAGHEYGNAFAASIYSDGSGLPDLTVNTKGRFSSMKFVVGIDAESECPRANARVWVADETGHVLWGPETVGITTPARVESLPIPDPIQVSFVNRSAEGESACDYGRADVSWGGVQFHSG